MKPPLEQVEIPIRWVFALLSASGSALIVAMSAAVYAARIESKTDFAVVRIDAIESNRHEEMQYLRRIEERLSRIEGKLDR